MPMMRKSIFDHEKRILIKHSVLLCLLHMRLNITAKINQQSLSLSYSVCMQTSIGSLPSWLRVNRSDLLFEVTQVAINEFRFWR